MNSVDDFLRRLAGEAFDAGQRAAQMPAGEQARRRVQVQDVVVSLARSFVEAQVRAEAER